MMRKFSFTSPSFGYYSLLFLAFLLLSLLFVMSICFGSVTISIPQVLSVLVGQNSDPTVHFIIWNLRLPRALIALSGGLMLGLAGCIYQTVLRNPIAEPSLLGVSSGSALFSVLWSLYAPTYLSNPLLLPLVALIGGLAAISVVLFLNKNTSYNSVQLILTGVMVGSVLQSITSLLLILKQQEMSGILLWIIGSLNGRTWLHWNLLFPWLIIGVPTGLALVNVSNILQLSPEIGSGLGLDINRSTKYAVIVASLLTAAVVSITGTIGFVGLIGPHIAKILVGYNAKRSYLVSCLTSAILLLTSDFIARSILLNVTPSHTAATLPVGAVTSFLGAPLFLILLWRVNK